MKQKPTKDAAHPLESNVRSYVRNFPMVVAKAKGTVLTDTDGKEYLDFLAGAGALNYGHNPDVLKTRLIEYLNADGIVHALDMSSTAKLDFIETFDQLVLKPRKLDYKLQFCGPTGTNAVEAALKLARMTTGSTGIVAFTNGFHGMTLGALSVTGNNHHKEGIPATAGAHTTFMPYCNYSDQIDSSLALFRQYLADNSSGVNTPAAVIVETVQGEGGINAASPQWLKNLRKLCDEYGMLMIVDDIQMGCGRTGDFFSFEEAGITPDIVVLSKSIGAYGLPMALVLLKPELDQWKPGQHNGTFRGHNLAFVAATEALKSYWATDAFAKQARARGEQMRAGLEAIAARFPHAGFEVRGRGLAIGFEPTAMPEMANDVRDAAFARQLIVETCGSADQVIKFLPPLTVSEAEVTQALGLLEEAIASVIQPARQAA